MHFGIFKKKSRVKNLKVLSRNRSGLINFHNSKQYQKTNLSFFFPKNSINPNNKNSINPNNFSKKSMSEQKPIKHDAAVFLVNRKKQVFFLPKGAPDILRHHTHKDLSRFYDLPRIELPNQINQNQIPNLLKEKFSFFKNEYPLGILNDADFDISEMKTFFYGIQTSDEENHHDFKKGKWYDIPKILSNWQTGDFITSPRTLHFLKKWNSNEKIDFETQDFHFSYEYAPGFEYIPLKSNTLKPFSFTNLIFYKEENEILIVDPGCNEKGQEGLVEILKNMKNQPTIFLTHHHKDHWDALPLISKFFPNSPVFGHPLTLALISTTLPLFPTPKTNSFSDFQNFILNLKDQKKENLNNNSNNNNNFFTLKQNNFEIIPSPGHTLGSLSLFEKKSKTLIPGDHIVGFGSSVLDFENGNMKKYIESCFFLKNFNSKFALPAHGPPCYSPNELLDQYIEHRNIREESIKKVCLDFFKKNEKKTESFDLKNDQNLLNELLDEIVKIVYKDTPQHLCSFAKGNIRLHLQKLSEEGKISVSKI